MRRTFRCWTYARASDKKQVLKGDSIPDQNKRTFMFYKENLEPEGIEFAGAIEDPGVSAYKVPFSQRPGGKFLVANMQPGDHVVFDKVDRIWRSLLDFCRLTEWFERRQVVFHIVSMQGMAISSNTPMGKFMLGLLVQVAELESAIKSERNLHSAAMRREEGRPVGRAPLGMRYRAVMTTQGNRKFLEWDEKERRLMGEIVRLRDEEGMSCEQISLKLCEDIAKATGKVFNPEFIGKRPWSRKDISNRYIREKQYREMEKTGLESAKEMNDALHQQARDSRREKILKRAAKATYSH